MRQERSQSIRRWTELVQTEAVYRDNPPSPKRMVSVYLSRNNENPGRLGALCVDNQRPGYNDPANSDQFELRKDLVCETLPLNSVFRPSQLILQCTQTQDHQSARPSSSPVDVVQ